MRNLIFAICLLLSCIGGAAQAGTKTISQEGSFRTYYTNYQLITPFNSNLGKITEVNFSYRIVPMAAMVNSIPDVIALKWSAEFTLGVFKGTNYPNREVLETVDLGYSAARVFPCNLYCYAEYQTHSGDLALNLKYLDRFSTQYESIFDLPEDEYLYLVVDPSVLPFLTSGRPFSTYVGDFSGDIFWDLTYVYSVPEASQWLMMIIGFGVLGAALRKARTSAARTRAMQHS